MNNNPDSKAENFTYLEIISAEAIIHKLSICIHIV